MRGSEICDRVVSAVVEDIDHQRELAIVVKRVGRQFVEAMAVEVTFPVRVPAPAGQRIVEAASAIAMLGAGLVTVVAGAEFVAVRVGPSLEFGPVTRDMEIIQVDQAFGDRDGYEHSIEDLFHHALISRHTGQVGLPLTVNDGSGSAGHQAVS